MYDPDYGFWVFFLCLVLISHFLLSHLLSFVYSEFSYGGFCKEQSQSQTVIVKVKKSKSKSKSLFQLILNPAL